MCCSKVLSLVVLVHQGGLAGCTAAESGGKKMDSKKQPSWGAFILMVEESISFSFKLIFDYIV